MNRYLSRAQQRLAKQLPGFNLTIADCFQMQQLCAYETVGLGYSEFCGLFTEEEWRGYAYANGMFYFYRPISMGDDGYVLQHCRSGMVRVREIQLLLPWALVMSKN